MRNNAFRGTGVALVTPFANDYSVDFRSLEAIVEHVIAGGADFLVVLGTTSEAPALSVDEKNAVLHSVIRVNKRRLPIMLGMGGNNTAALLQQIKSFDFAGVDGILTVVPYYNKPNQSGIKAHFTAVADVAPVPVVLYNVPGRVGVNMQASTCLELAQHPNICAVKEASGNLSQIMEILRDKPAGFDVLSGDDEITQPMMSLGAVGVISVAANAYTKVFSSMMQAMADGRVDKALSLHYAMLKMNKLIFADGNPAGIKTLLNVMGLCDNVLRLPLVSANDIVQDDIKTEWNDNLKRFI